ncbi:MAG TPA: CD225/dispanin family protein [Acidimicrobiales bacterium]|nr:CD225/dispanin family protein [Acidimicrobiales bacterium]
MTPPGRPPAGADPTTPYPQWGGQQWGGQQQPWAARPRTGWSRPSGSWWDRLLGTPAPAGAYGGAPPTYFWQALVCLFLFLPTGIAAVAYSLLVTRRAQLGDRNGSVRASQMARLWCLATLVLFAVLVLVTAATGWHG